REPGHIPRPVNAFILFRSHLNATEFAGSNNRELSKVAGERWRAMSDEEKRKFVLGAEVEKAKHAEMYPGYKYTP
ncbi:sox transcription factor 8, partial [Punctularia strigosozonata HHB-11173 SS5]|uniref:sox transcription factor 8 n=1 Tax=Punctularia strigosozonata (strain HHB-11173) TaxID=741275 RepID=UPI0004417FC0